MEDEESMSDYVSRLRGEGLSNDEITQRLLYEGYSNADIFEGISQADINEKYGGKMDYQNYEQEQQAYHNEAPPRVPSNIPEPMKPQNNSIDSDKIAEIAESIIEDKWADLVEHVNRIIEWKSSMELKLNSMEEQVKGLKDQMANLEKGVLGKIQDTDGVMREVSTDIKALEQVFKKILPGFVENVNELSRITGNLKKK